MSRHPVTPMDEADLRRHLSRQTDCPISLVDIVTLDSVAKHEDSSIEQLLHQDASPGEEPIVLFDTATEQHLQRVGQIIWDLTERQSPLFVVGSSGVGYALTSHWQSTGILGRTTPPRSIEPVDRLAIFSGSCSPVTEKQIAWAVDHGFTEIALDTPSLVDERTAEQAHAAAVANASQCLDSGKSVLLHTCRGPHDRRIDQTRDQLLKPGDSAEKLGRALGRLARSLLVQNDLTRLVFTGGDSSGYAARELGISALQYLGPIAPGCPLCLAHSNDLDIDGIEVAFKGGQVGRTDFFGQVVQTSDVAPVARS